MSKHRHHAIVVTSTKRGHIQEALCAARECFPVAQISDLVRQAPDLGDSRYSFFVGPDGSKEGWPQSDRGNAARDLFTDWLTARTLESDANHLYLQWVEVEYGDYTGYKEDTDRVCRSSGLKS